MKKENLKPFYIPTLKAWDIIKACANLCEQDTDGWSKVIEEFNKFAESQNGTIAESYTHSLAVALMQAVESISKQNTRDINEFGGLEHDT